jgi:heme-degrading monooxygenase HmoA
MMILRVWEARATQEGARDYCAFFAKTVLPQLRALDGFLDAEVFMSDKGDTRRVTVHTRWRNAKAIAAFAGSDSTEAVVEPEVAAIVLDYDKTVAHHARLFPIGETA